MRGLRPRVDPAKGRGSIEVSEPGVPEQQVAGGRESGSDQASTPPLSPMPARVESSPT